jgi:AraC-like DNA-binding protein
MRAVQGVGTIEAYLAQPVGHYLLGPTFVVWWSIPTLNGIMFWGRPDDEHVRCITAALEAHIRPRPEAHASLIDVRRVSCVDLGAFTALSHWVRSQREPLSKVVGRQALLRPDGLAGAAVAGFPAVLAPAYPIDVFTDPVEALGWLGLADQVAVLAELEEIYATASGGSAFVAAVRAHLEQRPGATLQDSARAFGLSRRNLQRKLSEAHTTFQAEQNAARVRAAKTLLLETNYDLKRIAFEVGCASLQNFSALFHKGAGESPSAWRAHQRPNDFPARPPLRSRASQS